MCCCISVIYNFFSQQYNFLKEILPVSILPSSSFPPTYLFLTYTLVLGTCLSGLFCPTIPPFLGLK